MFPIFVSEQEALHALDSKSQLAIQEVERSLGFRPLDSDGYPLSLCLMAIESEGDFPSILVNQNGKRLQSRTCPESFLSLFDRWAGLVPVIQRLPQQHRYDLQRAICNRLPPFPQSPYETNLFPPLYMSRAGIHRIADAIIQLAHDINTWRIYRARQAHQTYTLPNPSVTFPNPSLYPPEHPQTLQASPVSPMLRHPSPQPQHNSYPPYPYSSSPPSILSESPSNEAFTPGVGGFAPRATTLPGPSYGGTEFPQRPFEFPTPDPTWMSGSVYTDNQPQYQYHVTSPMSYNTPEPQPPALSGLGNRTPAHLSFGSNIPETRRNNLANVDDAANEIVDMISSQLSIFDIITRLGRHGCIDLSQKLNRRCCGTDPMKRGGFSDIYSGMLCDGTAVAIKTIFLSGQNDEEQKHLKRAARELYTWSKCEHPHIAPLLGLAEYRGRISMVSRWMNNGHVRAYVKKYPNADRFNLCIGIASAIEYLHDIGVIHGDLKGPNVLVSDEGQVMVIDFGNATLGGDSTLQFTATATSSSITLKWTASLIPPEMFEGSKHSMEGDVYALGMTILEIFTGEEPYPDKQGQAVVYAIMSNKIPGRPSQIPADDAWGDGLWKLLLGCWEKGPENRPKASQVHSHLKILQEQSRASFQPQ